MIRVFNLCFQSVKLAVNSIKAHAMRSLLTTLGIIIGVASVIAVVTIMEGLSKTISKGLNELGSNMVTLRAFTSIEKRMIGIENTLTYADFELLKNRVKDIEHITPIIQPSSNKLHIRYGRTSAQTQIIGTENSYQKLVKTYPDYGRFLKISDDRYRRRVAFIGHSLIKKLGMPDNPVGEFINLSGDWFRVIGVAESKGDLFGMDQDNFLMIPFTTLKSINGSKASDNIVIRFNIAPNTNLEVIKNKIFRLLEQKHKLKGNINEQFEFITAKKMKKNFSDITKAITFGIGGVVAISLLVGGIGIMNIMLVSVTERTKEIGIQKALGATPKFIMIQFLTEALILSFLGGIIGVLVGYLLAAFISLFIPSLKDVFPPIWAVVLSLGFTTTIGLIFGLAPAIKAAKLHPIQALSYE